MTTTTLTTSAWTTASSVDWASRFDMPLTIILHGGTFCVVDKDLQVDSLAAKNLLDALDEVDKRYPPSGWSWERQKATWVHKNWLVVQDNQGWHVQHVDAEPASKKLFLRADQARKWCEIRQDRVGMKLYGPKPRRENNQ